MKIQFDIDFVLETKLFSAGKVFLFDIFISIKSILIGITNLPRSIKSYFPTKEPVPKHLQSDIVYAAKCIDCGDPYVEKTERQCSRRLREHGAPKHTFDQHSGIEKITKPTTLKQEQQTNNTTVRSLEERRLKRRHKPYRLEKQSLVIRAHGPPLNRTTHSVALLIFPEGEERNLVPHPSG